MSRSPLLIGVWATVLIAVAGVALLNRPDQHNVGTPTNPPSSTASAFASAVPARVDPRIVGEWIGDDRPIQEIPEGGGARFYVTTFGTSYLTPAGNPLDNHLTSAASTAEGTLRLVTPFGLRTECAEDDLGMYTWSTTASGRVLRIEGINDACIPRIASMVGTWWRIGCHDANDGCLGDLDAGTYRSSFTTFHDPLPNHIPVSYGNLTYTVPDGWANTADWEAGLELEPSAVYATAVPGEDPFQKIEVVAHPTVARQDAACSPADEPGVEQTAAGMIRAITRLPSVIASAPTQISIDQLHGQMIDVRLSPSWTGVCPGTNGIRSAPMLHQAGRGGEGWTARLSATDRWRLIILELGGGNLAAIGIGDSESQATFDQLVATAMPIVQRLQFK